MVSYISWADRHALGSVRRRVRSEFSREVLFQGGAAWDLADTYHGEQNVLSVHMHTRSEHVAYSVYIPMMAGEIGVEHRYVVQRETVLRRPDGDATRRPVGPPQRGHAFSKRHNDGGRRSLAHSECARAS